MKEVILAIIIIFLGFFFLLWLAQPLEIIYDPNGPAYPYSLGGNDYH